MLLIFNYTKHAQVFFHKRELIHAEFLEKTPTLGTTNNQCLSHDTY